MPSHRGPAWSDEEAALTVAAYLDMFRRDLAGEQVVKSREYAAIAEQLDHRSPKAVEYKFQNISAVLVELDLPPMDGLRPAWNYQNSLYSIVAAQVGQAADLLAVVEAVASAPPSIPAIEDILNALESPPEAEKNHVASPPQRPRTGQHRDYLAVERRNAALGRSGEAFALQFEIARLRRAGAPKLADRIEHVSATQGDGLGFDIRSYEADGRDRYIEVKTTKFAKAVPFYVTPNELRVSQDAQDAYHLYRVFEFRVRPRLFTLPGSLDRTCVLKASEYVASVA